MVRHFRYKGSTIGEHILYANCDALSTALQTFLGGREEGDVGLISGGIKNYILLKGYSGFGVKHKKNNE